MDTNHIKCSCGNQFETIWILTTDFDNNTIESTLCIRCFQKFSRKPKPVINLDENPQFYA